eukprot:TRINITY_DN35868_c0_g1_i1.p1 TRINITY_DN35868_c0_g1~~TRINITY_DN35868_c0_g1_i1.p1  ORF type:complete len:578 (+),score=151.93 TRINITY_DN35868_c0_g1_i1:61-1794(+)
MTWCPERRRTTPQASGPAMLRVPPGLTLETARPRPAAEPAARPDPPTRHQYERQQSRMCSVLFTALSTLLFSVACTAAEFLWHPSNELPAAASAIAKAATGRITGPWHDPRPPLDAPAEQPGLLAPRLGSAQVLLLQCLVEGLFMSTVVALPIMVARLAQRAAERRFHEWTRSVARRRQRSDSGSIDTFTSRELRNCVLEDAWADVDDDSQISGASLFRRGTTKVRFNPVIDYSPTAPPPNPQPKSCLKGPPGPAIIAATAAAAATLTVMQATLHPPEPSGGGSTRRAALLLAAFGVSHTIAVGGQYAALVGDVSLCDAAVLLLPSAGWDIAVRHFVMQSAPPLSAALLSHQVLAGVLATAAVCLAAANNSAGGVLWTLLAGASLAVSQRLVDTLLRLETHAVAMGVSFVVCGALMCAAVLFVFSSPSSAWVSPTEEQWGVVMFLGLVALVGDAAAVAGPLTMGVHGPRRVMTTVSSTGGRAFAIVFALGLQTTVLDKPPPFSSSLAAVFGFGAGVLNDLCHLGGDEALYERLPIGGEMESAVELNQQSADDLSLADSLPPGSSAGWPEWGGGAQEV